MPLPVRKVREREEVTNLMNEQKLEEEGYFTRSRKKVKINDEGKEEQLIEENEFLLSMDDKN
jgi:hypothetical protein